MPVALAGVLAGALVALVACAPADDAGPDGEGAAGAPVRAADTAPPAGSGDGYVRPSADGGALVVGDTIPGHPSWTEQDWEVLAATVRWAREGEVATLPIGERIAAIGRHFVGTPYLPRTLDPPGPERLVVNLRALDCVTFVENMIALARFVEVAPADVLDRRDRALELYSGILTSLRYRGGVSNGYPSRLHYFSEWLQDAEDKGLLQVVTADIGGVVDPEPIHFMTDHRDAYPQLAEPAAFARLAEIEEGLSARTRYYVPEDRVADVQERIRTGDVIAATSTLEGLDVAHTGIALWEGGVLHLMHAPLVGQDVQISERPLAERLLAIPGQDGIMVARPLPVDGGR